MPNYNITIESMLINYIFENGKIVCGLNLHYSSIWHHYSIWETLFSYTVALIRLYFYVLPQLPYSRSKDNVGYCSCTNWINMTLNCIVQLQLII